MLPFNFKKCSLSHKKTKLDPGSTPYGTLQIWYLLSQRIVLPRRKRIALPNWMRMTVPKWKRTVLPKWKRIQWYQNGSAKWKIKYVLCKILSKVKSIHIWAPQIEIFFGKGPKLKTKYFCFILYQFQTCSRVVFTPLRVGWPPTPQVYFGPSEGLSKGGVESPPWRLPKLGNFRFSSPWGLPKRGNFHFSPLGASQAKNFHFPPPVGAPQAREFSLFPPVGAPQARECSLFPPVGLPKLWNFHFSLPWRLSKLRNFK